MFKIQTVNKISPAGLSRFGEGFSVADQQDNPDALILRSASLHEMQFPASLKAIARAGAGVNNIPVDRCAAEGIVVFNTPGANANAVKELVVAGLLLSSRKIPAGIQWAAGLKGQGAEVGKLVEKGKSAFVGPEIQGKTLGVIGLGAIGVLVANAAQALGMNVLGYDPYLSVDAAWHLSGTIEKANSLDDIFAQADYITIHVPYMAETKDYLNADNIAKMKDGVRILNFARGELVNTPAVLAGIASGKVAAYVTDFPNDDLLGVDGVIALPHLGASTPESEDNCARMAAEELVRFLTTGAIVNSVNFPTVELPPVAGGRLCVIHQNVPSMLSQISAKVNESGQNIETMVNKSKKDYAYTVLDTAAPVADSVVEAVTGIEGVVRAWKF